MKEEQKLYVRLAGVQTPPADEVEVDYETHRMVGKPFMSNEQVCKLHLQTMLKSIMKPTVWWGKSFMS